ncbi:MAG TPA: SpoIID/LytB domain-containing protein [Solirubrobacteraceae bacterium]|jgi:SpoIID/LytB domain protein
MRFLAHRSTPTARAGRDARALPRLQPRYHRPRGWLAGIAAALACAALGTWGSAAQAAPTLLISGAGFGHGVGMSQEGALGYAQHGYDYAAILAHYYTGTALGRVPSDQAVRVLLHGKVRRMPLEAYVRGVVGAEMPGDWPLAALEAQAVASRTYALTDHAGGRRFDVYADTRSQLYLGARAQTAQTNAAVAATAGQIVTYAGHPAITYFFASSGGATEDVQNGFPGAEPEPWLRGVADPYDQGPQHHWSTNMSFAAAASRLRGLVHGSFRGIEVLRRGYSPRILSAYVLGSGGPTPVSGPELANRLGLYDDWAYFSVRNPSGVAPEPDLSGHGVAAPTPGAPPAATGEPTAGARAAVASAAPSDEPAGGTSATAGTSLGPAGGTSPE